MIGQKNKEFEKKSKKVKKTLDTYGQKALYLGMINNNSIWLFSSKIFK